MKNRKKEKLPLLVWENGRLSLRENEKINPKEPIVPIFQEVFSYLESSGVDINELLSKTRKMEFVNLRYLLMILTWEYFVSQNSFNTTEIFSRVADLFGKERTIMYWSKDIYTDVQEFGKGISPVLKNVMDLYENPFREIFQKAA